MIELRPTAEADLDSVLELENHPDNAPFIGQWSRDEHRDTIPRPDREHWILGAPGSDERLGYLIALDLRAARCGVYTCAASAATARSASVRSRRRRTRLRVTTRRSAGTRARGRCAWC